ASHDVTVPWCIAQSHDMGEHQAETASSLSSAIIGGASGTATTWSTAGLPLASRLQEIASARRYTSRELTSNTVFIASSLYRVRYRETASVPPTHSCCLLR